MKWTKISLSLLVVFVAGLWIGYKVGFHDRPALSAKEALLLQISLDAGHYNALKEGKIDFVEDQLGVLLRGEIKAYDFYKKEDPSYNSQDEALKMWVEKGRIIAQEVEKQANSLPAETK